MLLPQLTGLPTDIRQIVDEQTRFEAPYLERALHHATRASQYSAKMTYLAGELSRRLGRDDEARQWYQQALDRSDLELRIREWIPGQMALLDPPRIESELKCWPTQ